MRYQFTTLRKFHYFSILCVGILFFGAQTVNNEPINISFNSDGYELKGKFYPAGGKGTFPTVLLLQGFPGNEKDVIGLGQKVSLSGINAFTFNYRGTHKSEGQFNLENTIDDIQAALDYLHKEEIVRKFKIDTSNIILCGYSYGGGMGLTFAANHPEIRRIISIVGTDHGEFIREYQRNESMAEMINDMFDGLKAPEGPVRFEGHKGLQELIDNVNLYDLRLSAPKLADREILLIGGWDDVNIMIENHLLPLYRVLKKEDALNVEFIAYHTDHSFRNVRDKLAEDIIEWIIKGLR
ncbi:MAG: alpha/beta fold hydrolase [candidate division WOR-3 bacterium]|nr:MAG: alpha/beta fold hydrolase [candidate division WOR-3 bacterium]